jgi:hypothetical protein
MTPPWWDHGAVYAHPPPRKLALPPLDVNTTPKPFGDAPGLPSPPKIAPLAPLAGEFALVLNP